MHVSHLFVLVLCVAGANAQFEGLISMTVSGLMEGGIKGTLGAVMPIANEGLTTLLHLFQAKIEAEIGLIKALWNAAPVFMSKLKKMFSDFFNANVNIVEHLPAAAKKTLGGITGMFGSGLSASFSVYGHMSAPRQNAVYDVLANVDGAAAAVMKLRMKHLQKATAEIPKMRAVWETPHRTQTEFVEHMKSAAPIISETMRTVSQVSANEFRSGVGKLEVEAKKGVDQMQTTFSKTLQIVEHALDAVKPEEQKQFGTLFHAMNNAVHVMHFVL